MDIESLYNMVHGEGEFDSYLERLEQEARDFVLEGVLMNLKRHFADGLGMHLEHFEVMVEDDNHE